MHHPVTPSLADFTPREFRNALSSFATGVTIVTTTNEHQQPIGLTVSSFNSVSLEPALVLWSLANKAHSLPVFLQSSHYAIHVLTADQGALAMRFAARDVDRWADLPVHRNAEGVPLLPHTAAIFECRNHSHHVEGDHVIFVGEVIRCQRHASAKPLIYHGGGFHQLQDEDGSPDA